MEERREDLRRLRLRVQGLGLFGGFFGGFGGFFFWRGGWGLGVRVSTFGVSGLEFGVERFMGLGLGLGFGRASCKAFRSKESTSKSSTF